MFFAAKIAVSLLLRKLFFFAAEIAVFFAAEIAVFLAAEVAVFFAAEIADFFASAAKKAVFLCCRDS